MADTSSLYTTLVNTSGVSRFFGYAARHGKLLPPGGQVTVFGGDFIHKHGFNLRRQQAFERDLIAGKIQVLSTPAPILHDTAPTATIAAPTAGPTVSVPAGTTGIVNPTTAVTLTATGGGASGGSLAAGTYFAKYTFVNGAGETTAGTSESTQLTVAAGNIPQATFPALPTGANSINLYLTPAGGASGTEVLYATGITTTTFNLSAAAPASTTKPPTSNTSAGQLGTGLALPQSYQVRQTYTNANGETVVGPPSAAFSITTLGQIPQITIPALGGGATATNLYIAPAGSGLIADPTVAATVAVTGGGSTGGLLAAGQYRVTYTFVKKFQSPDSPTGFVQGETTPGLSESTQFTVAAGNIPRVTLPALPALATSMNVYLTPPGGAVGSEILYLSGVTGTTADLSHAQDLSAPGDPAVNTTPMVGPQVGGPQVFQLIASGLLGSTTYNLAQKQPAYSDSLLPPAFNTTGGKSNRAMTVANGTLGVTDPSWGALRDN